MKTRILLGLTTVAFSTISTIAQVASAPADISRYSESRAYVPRVIENDKQRSDKKKRGKKRDAENTPVSPTIGTIETSGPFVIPVSAFDSQGALIKDLRADEFQVFVNDGEGDIVAVDRSAQPRNIFLLIDMSPSTDAKLNETKALLESIVKSFDPSDRIMVAQFNAQFKTLSELTNDTAEIEKAIKRLKMGNGTSIYEAVDKTSSELLGNLTGRTVLIVITDGVDTTSLKSSFTTSLMAVEKTNATVFPIYLDTFGTLPPGIPIGSLDPRLRQILVRVPGVPLNQKGSAEDEYEIGRYYLNDLARMSGGRAISYADPIHRSMPSIGEQLRNEYVLTVKPRSPIRIGERATVRVRVARPGLMIAARGSIIPSQ